MGIKWERRWIWWIQKQLFKGIFFISPTPTISIYRSSSEAKTVFEKLKSREAVSASVPSAVLAAIADFDMCGFQAIADYSRKFDGFELSAENIRVGEAEIRAQADKLTEKQRASIDLACAKTFSFQKKIARAVVSVVDSTADGSTTKFVPIPMKRIGIYVPGGLAALPSSLMMVAVSALAAGVKDLVVCTPPRNEGLNPAIAYLLLKFDIREIYRVGGVAAIWLMANGLQLAKRKIAPVDKICGPGNAYVAEAKAQLAQSGKVGIDMIAGPSEVLVLADKSSIANSNYIAADLLAQAEHGLTSSALLFTDSDDLAVQVQKEVESQLAKIKRGKEIAQALRACGGIFVVDDLLKDGVPLADDFASEHLEIFCSEQLTQAILTRGICAGAIFIRTGEAFADYGMTGGNHVLPTSRTARFSSGLSARDFVVWQYQEELSNATQEELAEATATFALELESLEAHANAAKVRGR